MQKLNSKSKAPKVSKVQASNSSFAPASNLKFLDFKTPNPLSSLLSHFFLPPGSARARASPASGHVLASPRRRLAVPSRLPRRRSACCASAPSAHHHASTPSPAPSHPLANPTFPGAAARATGSAPLPAPTRPLCATEPPQRPLPPPLGYLSKPKPSSPHLSPLLPLCR